MTHINEGQCGLCTHFDEHSKRATQEIVKIRRSHEAKEDLLAECGHPEHKHLHLRVSPLSGCDGFAPADGSAQTAR